MSTNSLPKPVPTPEFVEVTPDMAKKWLQTNKVNRKLRDYQVQKWARDMAAGRWTYSNDAICIDPDGTLINGQHRLHGVIESDIPAIMLIIWDMPLEAMIHMDSGTGKTAADALGLRGEKNTPSLAAIAKQCILIDDGRVYKDNKTQVVSHPEIAAFIDEHPEMRTAAEVATRVTKRLDVGPAPLGAAYWMISQVNGDDLAEHYMDKLATREEEGRGSAVLAVDSRLRELRKNKATVPIRNYIYLLIKGWNYWSAGRPISALYVAPKGVFRIPEVARWRRP